MVNSTVTRQSTATSRRAFDVSKRVFDIVVSGVGLVVATPVMVVTGILVYRKMGSPVIFSQDRPGKDGRVFRLRKFRTMVQADSNTSLLHDHDRLTDFGRKLRATSLDELPTLWNVLAGDMSLVGPRPLLVKYLPLYSPEQSRRHEIRPGITGLAQVNGRNLLDWKARFELDVQYVDSRSWRLDCRILAQTIGLVLRREGISQAGHSTMPEFLGPDR
ncbi:MAG: sugar transferase [Propionibacteriaceae bacterium]|nr:sugar transferase [Propionibacteriaceae bacterium]